MIFTGALHFRNLGSHVRVRLSQGLQSLVCCGQWASGSLTLLVPQPGSRSLRGARLGEPRAQLGRHRMPSDWPGNSIGSRLLHARQARRVKSRSGKKGRLTCSRDIGSRYLTMAGMAFEG